MSTNLKKNNDYHILFNIKDKDGNKIPLSYFSNYEVKLTGNNGLIRTLKTTNTVSEGKLYEYDTQTLEFYLETRDTNLVNLVVVTVNTEWSNTNLSDGVFNNSIIVGVYKFG